MKLSKIASGVLVSSLMAASVAQAAVEVSGSLAFTTDYKFRGLSQTSNNVAVQGSLTASHDSGAYATFWGSSVSGLTGGSETNAVLGYSGEIADVTYDVGYLRYIYAGANADNFGTEPDYDEVYASVSAKGAKLGLAYSPDYFGESGEFLYTYVSYGTEVAGVGLSASVGLNSFLGNDAEITNFFGSANNDDYVDYKIAASKSFKDVGFELAYIGTNLDEDDYPFGVNPEGSVVLTVSKSF